MHKHLVLHDHGCAGRLCVFIKYGIMAYAQAKYNVQVGLFIIQYFGLQCGIAYVPSGFFTVLI